MNYSSIISNSLITKSDLLSDFFVSECRKAERDEFISPKLFFDGCNDFCEGLRRSIVGSYSNLMNRGMREVLKDGMERPFQLDINDFSYPFSNLQVKISDIERLERMIEVAKIEYIDLPALINQEKELTAKFEKEKKNNQATLTPLIRDNYTVRLKNIHSYLKAGRCIDCSENDFLFWFGQKEMKKNPPKIHWLKADSVLKNVIQQLCGQSGEKHIKIAFIFKTKYVTTNYKKDYVGSAMYLEIDSFMHHSTQKI